MTVSGTGSDCGPASGSSDLASTGTGTGDCGAFTALIVPTVAGKELAEGPFVRIIVVEVFVAGGGGGSLIL